MLKNSIVKSIQPIQEVLHVKGKATQVWLSVLQTIVIRVGQPGTFGFQVWRPNHSATLPSPRLFWVIIPFVLMTLCFDHVLISKGEISY